MARSEASKEHQRVLQREWKRKRRADPEYRELERQQALAYNENRDREKENARRRERVANDPEYREHVNQRAQGYRLKRPPEEVERRRAYQQAYHTSPENRARANVRARERYANNPEYRERERARKASPEYQANYRAYVQQRYYGMAPGEFDAMLEEQGGVCRICGKAVKLYVDHCHVTGAARGLLCPNCNTGLGMLGDNSDAIESALRYLKEAEQRIAETLQQ